MGESGPSHLHRKLDKSLDQSGPCLGYVLKIDKQKSNGSSRSIVAHGHINAPSLPYLPWLLENPLGGSLNNNPFLPRCTQQGRSSPGLRAKRQSPPKRLGDPNVFECQRWRLDRQLTGVDEINCTRTTGTGRRRAGRLFGFWWSRGTRGRPWTFKRLRRLY